ncbi:MAG: hypothetical protein HY856_16050 [Burkholderiales bacterium]|nr:hypothetical protein [Burkholderiales bacterium]
MRRFTATLPEQTIVAASAMPRIRLVRMRLQVPASASGAAHPGDPAETLNLAAGWFDVEPLPGEGRGDGPDGGPLAGMARAEFLPCDPVGAAQVLAGRLGDVQWHAAVALDSLPGADAQAWVDALRQAGRCELLLGLARRPGDFAGLKGIDGFVLAGMHGLRRGQHLWHMLAGLLAPTQLIGVDARDVAQVLGAALRPSDFVPAVWLPQEQRLLLDGSGREALSRADGVFASPIGQEWPAAQVRSVVRQLREHLPPGGADLAVCAPQGLFPHDEPSSLAIPFGLLVRGG